MKIPTIGKQIAVFFALIMAYGLLRKTLDIVGLDPFKWVMTILGAAVLYGLWKLADTLVSKFWKD